MDVVKQEEGESGGGGIQGNQLTSDRKQRSRVLPLNAVEVPTSQASCAESAMPRRNLVYL